MDEAEVVALFDQCSNVGRWGADDEVGTLNLITPEHRLRALRVVRSGRLVSLGFDLPLPAAAGDAPASLRPRYEPVRQPGDASDTLSLAVHGYQITHVDAPGHMFFEGRAWGGRTTDDVASETGLSFGSIRAIGERGVVTRGVLLDVARARGLDLLPAGDGISVSDLEAAEELAGVTVESGDAVFVRSGHGLRAANEGRAHDEETPHEGLLAEVMPWFHERDIAVYAGDCIERRPSGYGRVPMPLHQIGLVAMGLCILDVVDMEGLAAACREEGRAEFLLMMSALRVPGGSGSAVNPLAVF